MEDEEGEVSFRTFLEKNKNNRKLAICDFLRSDSVRLSSDDGKTKESMASTAAQNRTKSTTLKQLLANGFTENQALSIINANELRAKLQVENEKLSAPPKYKNTFIQNKQHVDSDGEDDYGTVDPNFELSGGRIRSSSTEVETFRDINPAPNPVVEEINTMMRKENITHEQAYNQYMNNLMDNFDHETNVFVDKYEQLEKEHERKQEKQQHHSGSQDSSDASLKLNFDALKLAKESNKQARTPSSTGSGDHRREGSEGNSLYCSSPDLSMFSLQSSAKSSTINTPTQRGAGGGGAGDVLIGNNSTYYSSSARVVSGGSGRNEENYVPNEPSYNFIAEMHHQRLPIRPIRSATDTAISSNSGSGKGSSLPPQRPGVASPTPPQRVGGIVSTGSRVAGLSPLRVSSTSSRNSDEIQYDPNHPPPPEYTATIAASAASVTAPTASSLPPMRPATIVPSRISPIRNASGRVASNSDPIPPERTNSLRSSTERSNSTRSESVNNTDVRANGIPPATMSHTNSNRSNTGITSYGTSRTNSERNYSNFPSRANSDRERNNNISTSCTRNEDDEALRIGILISQQEALYGINMFMSYDKIHDKPYFDSLLAQGVSENDAYLIIFEKKFPPAAPEPPAPPVSVSALVSRDSHDGELRMPHSARSIDSFHRSSRENSGNNGNGNVYHHSHSGNNLGVAGDEYSYPTRTPPISVRSYGQNNASSGSGSFFSTNNDSYYISNRHGGGLGMGADSFDSYGSGYHTGNNNISFERSGDRRGGGGGVHANNNGSFYGRVTHLNPNEASFYYSSSNNTSRANSFYGDSPHDSRNNSFRQQGNGSFPNGTYREEIFQYGGGGGGSSGHPSPESRYGGALPAGGYDAPYNSRELSYDQQQQYQQRLPPPPQQRGGYRNFPSPRDGYASDHQQQQWYPQQDHNTLHETNRTSSMENMTYPPQQQSYPNNSMRGGGGGGGYPHRDSSSPHPSHNGSAGDMVGSNNRSLRANSPQLPFSQHHSHLQRYNNDDNRSSNLDYSSERSRSYSDADEVEVIVIERDKEKKSKPKRRGSLLDMFNPFSSGAKDPLPEEQGKYIHVQGVGGKDRKHRFKVLKKDVVQLMQLGFHKEACVQALLEAKHNRDAAADLLFSTYAHSGTASHSSSSRTKTY